MSPATPRRLALPALLSLGLLSAGCASRPPSTAWSVQEVPVDWATACARPDAGAGAMPASPRGVTVIRSVEVEAHSSRTDPRTPAERATGPDRLVVAAGTCLFVLDPAGGPTTPLRAGDGPFRPTRVGASTNFLVILDEEAGGLRWLDVHTGKVTRSMVRLEHPVDLAVLPGGATLVTEYNGGRVLELRPGEDTRPRLVGKDLGAPVAATAPTPREAYVVDATGGRVLRVGLKMESRAVIATGLDRPAGLAAMEDGRLAVVETGAGRVVLVDPKSGDTEVIATGLAAHAAGDADVPALALARGSDGTLYVADPVAGRLLRISPPPPAAR